jgi:hypothetical protein
MQVRSDSVQATDVARSQSVWADLEVKNEFEKQKVKKNDYRN